MTEKRVAAKVEFCEEEVRIRSWVVAAAVLLAMNASQAPTPANAALSCTVNAGGTLPFGSHPALAGAGPFNVTGSFGIQCNAAGATRTPVTVSLDAGLNAAGIIANRKMKRTTLPAVFLGYQIYQNAAHTTIFGNGAGQTRTVNTTGSATKNINLFGQIPTTTANPGIYNDTVNVTITF